MALLLKSIANDVLIFDSGSSDIEPMIENLNLTLNHDEGKTYYVNKDEQKMLCYDISKQALIDVLSSRSDIGALRLILAADKNKLVLIATPLTTNNNEIIDLSSTDDADKMLSVCCPQPGGSKSVGDSALAARVFGVA